MPQYIEFQGKNVDSALKEAGERLNKPIEKIRYEVVSYGSSGIFGLVGAKKAKIRIKSEDAFGIDQDTKAQARDLVNDAFEIQDEPVRQTKPKSEDKPKKTNKKPDASPKKSEPKASRISQFARIIPIASSLPEKTTKNSLKSRIWTTIPLKPIPSMAKIRRLLIYFHIPGILWLQNLHFPSVRLLLETIKWIR